MKPYSRSIPLLAFLLLLVASCGYHNPNIYTGPDRVIYLMDWKNRTSQLGLDATFYQSLVKWYQKSGSISLTKKKEDAQLILAGEIVSISLPSRSYDADQSATEVRVSLRVRYVLKDLTTNKIVIEAPGETWTETYLTGGSTSETRANQRKAIATIVEDISERIYQKSLMKLNQQ